MSFDGVMFCFETLNFAFHLRIECDLVAVVQIILKQSYYIRKLSRLPRSGDHWALLFILLTILYVQQAVINL